jgi:addiction module HigA family antidote
MVRIPNNRAPTHPGVILLEDFLKPLGITQSDLADAIHVPYQRVNAIVNERRGVTPSTALRLAKFFGNSPGFWMNLQLRYDLYDAREEESDDLEDIDTMQAKSPAT